MSTIVVNFSLDDSKLKVFTRDGISDPETALRKLINILKGWGDRVNELHFEKSICDLADDLLVYISNYCSDIKGLQFDCLNPCWVKDLHHLFSKCRYIESLLFEDTEKVFTDDHLYLVLSSSWKLTSLKVARSLITRKYLNHLYPTLTSLDIRFCKNLTVQSLNQIKDQCPNLKCLRTSFLYNQFKLNDVNYYWPNLDSFVMETKVQLSFANLFKNMTNLSLNSLTNEAVSMRLLLDNLPNLQRLQLDVESVCDEVLTFDDSVKTLIIRTLTPLPDNVVLSLPFCHNLEILHIRGTNIAYVLEDILAKCTKLQSINSLDTVMPRSKLLSSVQQKEFKHRVSIQIRVEDSADIFGQI